MSRSAEIVVGRQRLTPVADVQLRRPDRHLRPAALAAVAQPPAQTVLGARLMAFVTYDRRLLAAAAGLSLPVASPGRSNLTHDTCRVRV